MARKIEIDFRGRKKAAKERKINIAKGLAVGAIAGSALGTLGGILFAPKSGKETRKQIKDDVNAVAKRAADEVKELGEKTVSGVKDAVTKANLLMNEKLGFKKENCCCEEVAVSDEIEYPETNELPEEVSEENPEEA